MTTRVLVDTSAWIEALRRDGDASLREAVREATLAGAAVVCDLVRLELSMGVGDPGEQKRLRTLEAELENLETTRAVWERARELARAARAAGVTAPATDILIVACALEHRCGVLHRDAHFDRLLALAGPP